MLVVLSVNCAQMRMDPSLLIVSLLLVTVSSAVPLKSKSDDRNAALTSLNQGNRTEKMLGEWRYISFSMAAAVYSNWPGQCVGEKFTDGWVCCIYFNSNFQVFLGGQICSRTV